MASFVRMPFILVFHQGKYISTIKRMLFYYRHVCILVFYHVLMCSLLLRCMLKSSALRVGVKMLYNIMHWRWWLASQRCKCWREGVPGRIPVRRCSWGTQLKNNQMCACLVVRNNNNLQPFSHFAPPPENISWLQSCWRPVRKSKQLIVQLLTVTPVTSAVTVQFI